MDFLSTFKIGHNDSTVLIVTFRVNVFFLVALLGVGVVEQGLWIDRG